MLRFHDSIYLWALAALPLLGLLYLYVLAQKRQTAKRIGDAALVQSLTQTYSPRKALLKFALLVLAFAVGILALANLKKPAGSQQAQLNGIDILLAVDVSKSMLAQDVKPNRLERARQLLTRLTSKLAGHRIGIVVFAGHAYIQMPLTADNNAARLYLAAISTEMVPVQGTVIGEALKMCYNSFNAQEKKYKAVVLLSDGEDHDPAALSTAASMAEEGIVIHTVGFGSAEGSSIVDPVTNEIKRDKDGNTVVSQLNEGLLRQIAEKGRGSYQAFTTSDEVADRLERQLNGLEKRPVSATMGMAYTYYFPWLLGVALLLLLAEWLISEKKRVARGLVMAMLLAWGMPTWSVAQATRQQMKKANTAYQRQSYNQAVEQYKAILQKKPGYLAAQYNLANALLKAGQQEAALKAYEAALQLATTPQQKAAIYYNQGVAYHQGNRLAEAIKAYQNALRLDPSDQAARLNLQKAMQQQQKEQQQRQGPQPSPPKPPKKEPPSNKKQDPPQPPPSKLSQKQAEEKLKALLQEEKNLQEKLRKNPVTTLEKKEKDW